MSTFITLVLASVAVAVVAYLFSVISDKDTGEKGKCDSKDYEIADSVAVNNK